MKKYEVRVWEIISHHRDVIVEAESEHEAREKAYDAATANTMDWEFDDADISEMDILREVSDEQ